MRPASPTAGPPWIERAIRPILAIGAAFNAAVALVLLMPSAFAGLPPAEPEFRQWVLAYLIALCGAAYAWMARQPVIPRPLVALAAIGKGGVFVIALVCLLRGSIDARTFAFAGVDLAFAACFVAWWRAGR